MIPYDKRSGKIWYNSELVDWRTANVHVLNHGLHYASCVFEGERAYNGKIFETEQHTNRLFKSAESLDMRIPFTENDIIEAKNELLKKNSLIDAYVRPVVWRGSEMMAISAKKGSTNLAIAAWEWPSYFSPSKLLEGIKLNISKWLRPSPESAPTDSKAAGLYMICSLSKHEAEKLGFDDALMLDYRGFIAEATGANIFFVKENELFTPIADCFLNGITRQTVIEIAKENKIKVHEKHFKLDFLKTCEEVFLTGTAVEITPVSRINDFNFKDRKLTKFLIS
jgi:branched-chain amino acid aminotransferase